MSVVVGAERLTSKKPVEKSAAKPAVKATVKDEAEEKKTVKKGRG